MDTVCPPGQCKQDQFVIIYQMELTRRGLVSNLRAINRADQHDLEPGSSP